MDLNKTKTPNDASPSSLQSPIKNKIPRKIAYSHSKSSHHPFLSKANRFHYEYLENPGPGSYDQASKEKHTSDYHVIKQKYPNGIGKQHMWIVSKGRQLFQSVNWKAQIGPGKYTHTKMIASEHSGWAKNSRFNYQKVERKVNLGPGSYGLSQNLLVKKPVAASAFKSKSNKSHLDELVKGKLKLHQKKANPENQFDKIQQVIEKEWKKTLQKGKERCKSHGSPVFLSKIDRLPKTQAEEVGPGSYTIQSSFGKQSRRRVQTDVHKDDAKEVFMQKHCSSRIIGPGPGAYNIAKSPEEGRQAALGLILKQGRFKSSVISDRRWDPTYFDTAGKQHQSRLVHSRQAGSGDISSVYDMLKRVERQKQEQSRLLLLSRKKEQK